MSNPPPYQGRDPRWSDQHPQYPADQPPWFGQHQSPAPPAGRQGFSYQQPGQPYPGQTPPGPQQPYRGQPYQPSPPPWQQQPGPHTFSFGPQQPGPVGANPKKRRTIVLGGAAVLLVAVVVIVVAFVRPWNSDKNLIFHPNGPANAWLDERYAGGSTSWSADGLMAGVSFSRSVVALSSDDALAGLDLSSGQELWRVDGAICGDGAVIDGNAYCVEYTDTESALLRIDLDTGSVDAFYAAPIVIHSVTPLGERDGNVILAAGDPGGTRLLSIALDGSGIINWQTVYPEVGVDCYLLSTHIGCSGYKSTAFGVVDASTGEFTVQQDLNTADEERVVWVWDGYTLPQGWFDNEERPVFDFNQNEVGRVRPGGEPLTPSSTNRVFFTVEDLMMGGTVQAVDADGTVVADYANGTVLQPSGHKLPTDGSVVAVSADGSLLAAEVEYGRYEIYDRDGNEVNDFGGGDTNMTIVDGLVVSWDPSGPTIVHAPMG